MLRSLRGYASRLFAVKGSVSLAAIALAAIGGAVSCGLASAPDSSGFEGPSSSSAGASDPGVGGSPSFGGSSPGGSTNHGGGGAATNGSGAASSNGGGGNASTSTASSSASSSTASSTASSSAMSSSASSSASSSSGGPVNCGNGRIDSGEQCDDHGAVNDDGCNASCQFENPNADNCPGTKITLSTGDTMLIAESTSGANDTFQHASGGNCLSGNYPGNDLIYAVTPRSSGTLTAKLAASFATHVLRVRDACTEKDDLDCDYHRTAATDDQISIPVTGGSTYYVIVDSYMSTSGTFVLTLAL